MQILDPAVVLRAGGRVDWLKPKGPEHVVFDYWIFSWLGRNAFAKQKDLFDRIQACSHQLGSLAIICRSYASKRDRIQEFHDEYLNGPTTIPLEAWNANYLVLEEAVVDIESFFWFANRLLTHIALTMNYFFKNVKPKGPKATGVRSHSTFVQSVIFKLLPLAIQEAATKLKTDVSDFRNTDIEHDMKYWRSRKASFADQKQGEEAQVKITFPPTSYVLPQRPLRDLWIELHDYLTEVAKYLGTQLEG